jgi:hypothetical protein
MAYSQKEWESVRAYFERGLSLSEIVGRDDIAIKSKSQISKKATSEGWEKSGEKKQLLDREIQIKQEVAAISEQKETLKETERSIHNVLVDERTKHIEFFSKAAIRNVSVAVKKIGDGTTQMEHRMLAETILKGRETVLGKTPDTAIQINNNNNVQSEKYEDLTDEQLEACLADLKIGKS